MAKYVGITIGPIINTISKAKQTAELWGASYIFSYFMKNLVEKLNKNYKVLDHPSLDNLSNENKNYIESSNVGFFHDRCVFKIEDSEILNLEEYKTQIIKKLVIDLKYKEKEKLENYLEEYIQLDMCEYISENNENLSEIMQKVMHKLDIVELKADYIKSETIDYLMDAVKNKNIKGSDIYKSEMIPSTDTIALKKGRKSFQYQNYFAIVQVDADNMGNLVKISNEQEIKEISEKNLLQAIESVKLIEEYDGFVYYAGGDDLLFMAPICSDRGNIFSLIQEINDKFKKTFEKEINRFNKNKSYNDKNIFSQSFGLAITHRKHPLREGQEIARTMLFNRAKRFIGRDHNKSAIAVSFVKHSGKQLELMVQHESKSYKKFVELIESKQKVELKSVVYKLEKENLLLEHILKSENKKVRLEYYFDNSFNEDMHSSESAKEYLKKVQNMILCIQDNSIENITFMDYLRFYLKFLAFLEIEALEKAKEENNG